MTASFDGNDGNDGNAANAGGGGNATSMQSGWFFADRVGLPFVTILDSGPISTNQPIAGLRVNVTSFPPRNWSAEWLSWLALTEFVQTTGWQTIDILPPWMPAGGPFDWSPAAHPEVTAEIQDLVTAAQDERSDALGEILSQQDEFISYFLNLLSASPGGYPATTQVLTIASQIGTFCAMYYKGLYQRPRPSQICPALLPPVAVPGHASLPSGHSTQAHLMALCLVDVLATWPDTGHLTDDVWTLADRIARNREIAGLHYASDTEAGKKLAAGIKLLLKAQIPNPPGGVAGTRDQTWYPQALAAAKLEWT